MTRKFLEDLGLEKEAIDKILDENSADIGKELAKTNSAKTELAAARAELQTAQEELDALKKSSGDAGELQKQFEELKSKYETDTAALQKQISDREYTDAISAAIAAANDGKGLKFTSHGAKTAFIAALREKGLELKDGALDKKGFEAFVKAQKEADPDGFASDTPVARFAARVGAGGAPEQPKSRAAERAARYNQNLYGTPKESEK